MTVQRVAVVGGGLVGLCTAHHLRGSGREVVVLERDRVGSGASRGNVGEVCPALCLPLPAPGVVSHSLRTLLRRDSPLYVRPQASPELVRFLLGFAWNTRRRQFAAGARALAQLSREAVSHYRALAASGIGIAFNELPFLFVYGTPEEAEAGRRFLRDLDGAGSAVSEAIMDRDELAALEPCLTGDISGFALAGQLTLDPGRFVDELAAELRAAGVEIREGARATSISDAGVETTAGRVEADATVLAAGIWSAPLAATAGIRLPIFPGKGYSFSVPVAQPPRHQIHLESAHVVIAPLGATTRVGGTMELDRLHDRFDPGRVEAIVVAARPHLRAVDWERRTAEWVGPRPMTPTGLPFIGLLGGSGRMFVAAGHNMFGLTLAPSTGHALAQLIVEGRADVDLSPFDPARIRR